MHVFDVAGKSAIYYAHHEAAKVIAKCLCDENGRAPLTSQMWMLNEECACHLLSTIMVEVANFTEFGIKCLRTSKACRK